MALRAGRHSRWGSQSTAAKLANLNVAIEGPMTAEQVEAYALHVRIEEITQILKADNVAPANRFRRSPSPSPQYDDSGRRINTRHRRYRDRLVAEQRSLIQQAARIIPNYRAPAGYTYTAPTMMKDNLDKVYIPVKDFPEVNFIGQILGPRGRSLTQMSAESGATIVLRGKGSVKEGRGQGRGRDRGRGRNDHLNDNEPLHCLIMADSQDKIDKARALVQHVIEVAATTPEHDNGRKREQLRHLAIVNGTFRDDEGLGRTPGDGEDRWGTRPGRPSIVCHVCGCGGHIARDCGERKVCGPRGSKTPPWWKTSATRAVGNTLDTLYSEFLSEL